MACVALWSVACATPWTSHNLACQRAGYWQSGDDNLPTMTPQYAIAMAHTFDAEPGSVDYAHQQFVWERNADLEKLCFQNRLR